MPSTLCLVHCAEYIVPSTFSPYSLHDPYPLEFMVPVACYSCKLEKNRDDVNTCQDFHSTFVESIAKERRFYLSVLCRPSLYPLRGTSARPLTLTSPSEPFSRTQWSSSCQIRRRRSRRGYRRREREYPHLWVRTTWYSACTTRTTYTLLTPLTTHTTHYTHYSHHSLLTQLTTHYTHHSLLTPLTTHYSHYRLNTHYSHHSLLTRLTIHYTHYSHYSLHTLLTPLYPHQWTPKTEPSGAGISVSRVMCCITPTYRAFIY